MNGTGSSPALFTVRPPTVSSVSPATGPASGGTGVMVSGSGFTGATAVRFGAATAPSFMLQSDTQLTAIAPPGTGTVQVTVTTPAGTSTEFVTYTYGSGSAPSLTAVSP